MAETKQIAFTHKEVVRALVKQEGIHDGIWGIYVKFGIAGANIGASDSDMMPSAIVPVLELGLQRFPKENNLSVDASIVNPKEKKTGKSPARKKR